MARWPGGLIQMSRTSMGMAWIGWRRLSNGTGSEQLLLSMAAKSDDLHLPWN